MASEPFGFTASKGDYNKDGVPDLLTGGIGRNDREIYVSDGRDGSPLKTLRLPDSESDAARTRPRPRRSRLRSSKAREMVLRPARSRKNSVY